MATAPATTTPATATPAANPAPAAGKGTGKPCFEFQKTGQCKYGADCKFSHVKVEAKPAAAHTGRGGAWAGRGGATAGAAADAAPVAGEDAGAVRGGGSGRGRGRGRGGRGGANALPRVKKPCKAILEGRECPYGAECHFSHDPAGDAKKLAIAKAKKALADKKVMCQAFLKGSCPFGKICRHSHDMNDAKQAPAPAPASAAAAAPAAAPAAEQRAAPAPAPAPTTVAAAAGQAPAPAKPTPAAPTQHAPQQNKQSAKPPKQGGAAGGKHRGNHQIQQPNKH